MNENPLSAGLAKCLQSKSLLEVTESLKTCRTLLACPGSSELITTSTISLLSSLLDNFGYQILIPVSKFYNLLFSKISKSSPELMFELCVQCYSLNEVLHGTDIGYVLKQTVKQECGYLLDLDSMSAEQKKFLKSVSETRNKTLSDELLRTIIDEIKENDSYFVNRIKEFLSSMDSVRDQFASFEHIIEPVIAAIEETARSQGLDREIHLKLLELLQYFVFRFNFNVRLSNYDLNDYKTYTIFEIKLVSIYQEILQPIISLINIIKSSDIFITQHLVPILHRLWIIFPTSQNILYDYIYTILTSVALNGPEEAKTQVFQLLKVIIEDPDTSREFKAKIEAERAFDSILQLKIENEFIFEAGEPSDLNSLNVSIGFPLCVSIPAGCEWSHLVEVPEPNCIISWGFATETNDLSFIFTRVDMQQPEIIMLHNRVRCDDIPSTEIRLLSSPGLYKLTWSNTYSWFRSKHLRYKVFLLRPYKHIIRNPPQPLNKIISILNSEENCNNHFNEDGEGLGIGVQIEDNTVSILGIDNKVYEFPIQENLVDSDNKVVRIISDFIENILNSKRLHHRSIKIGIVQHIIKRLPGVEALGAIALAKVLHALALLNQSVLHSHTLIVVYQRRGLRSCVMHKGKILCSEDRSDLGDLSRLEGISVEHGVGMMLCMYGPAYVILAGDVDQDLKVLRSKVSKYVPLDIWNNSVIEESKFSAVQAAGELHNLHLKYKFSM